jgi:hypothetical protein
MSKHIPVPPELQHLIEKREQENDRRKTSQPAAGNTPPEAPSAPSGSERRQKRDRRRRPKSGS